MASEITRVDAIGTSIDIADVHTPNEFMGISFFSRHGIKGATVLAQDIQDANSNADIRAIFPARVRSETGAESVIEGTVTSTIMDDVNDLLNGTVGSFVTMKALAALFEGQGLFIGELGWTFPTQVPYESDAGAESDYIDVDESAAEDTLTFSNVWGLRPNNNGAVRFVQAGYVTDQGSVNTFTHSAGDETVTITENTVVIDVSGDEGITSADNLSNFFIIVDIYFGEKIFRVTYDKTGVGLQGIIVP